MGQRVVAMRTIQCSATRAADTISMAKGRRTKMKTITAIYGRDGPDQTVAPLFSPNSVNHFSPISAKSMRMHICRVFGEDERRFPIAQGNRQPRVQRSNGNRVRTHVRVRNKVPMRHIQLQILAANTGQLSALRSSDEPSRLLHRRRTKPRL